MTNNKVDFLKNINSDFLTLYVEDDEQTRIQTVKVLESFLPAVITSKDGEEGLELFKKHIYNKEMNNIDLIISDIRMPKINGLEMIKEIKDISPSMPVILLSAHHNKEYFLEAINIIGVDSFLLKPYTLEQVVNVLFQTIQKQYKSNIFTLKDAFMEIENDIVPIGKSYYYDYINESLFYKEDLIDFHAPEFRWHFG